MNQLSSPYWLEVAIKELGQKEVPSFSQNNPRILEYHGATKLQATEDEVPWCSSFVNWTMRESGILGTESAAASSWATWGKSCEAALGAVALLKMDTASGVHVGLLWWIDPAKLLVLGGNQGDSVNITSFKRDRLIGFRWPTHWMSGLPVADSGKKAV